MERDFADMIKLRTLRWKDRSGLSGWVIITWVLKNGEPFKKNGNTFSSAVRERCDYRTMI
jgi:hypothetical protein